MNHIKILYRVEDKKNGIRNQFNYNFDPEIMLEIS